MNRLVVSTVIVACIGVGAYILLQQPDEKSKGTPGHEALIKLPEPRYKSATPLEEAILERRSIRDYKDEPLTLTDLSQVLWAAQGITDPRGYRTAPSAGALYPLELYVAAGNVEGVPDGIYRYKPEEHELARVAEGHVRAELYSAALDQSAVKDAAAVIVFSAVYERTTGKYGGRGIRYVHIEVGHAAQNVYLQAVSQNLGTVVIGAFDDEDVKTIMNMADDEQPLLIMPVGKVD